MKLIIYTRGNIEEGDPALIMNTFEEIQALHTETDQDGSIWLHIYRKDSQNYDINFDPEIDSLMIVE